MRRGYLDWMRGLAVLIMVEAHAVDAWTQAADRRRLLFGDALVLGGFGAPLFLFLAGVSVALSCGSKARSRGSVADAVRLVERRGLEILGLAFLFRLQSYLLNPGSAAIGLLKVDILNIMGPAIVAAAALWGAAKTSRRRVFWFSAIAAAVALLTPLVRTTPWLGVLPDPVEWYLRPYAGRTNFTVFPWAGFVFAGSVIGVLLDEARVTSDQRRLVWWTSAVGAALALVSYCGSYLPSIFAQSSFWTSSPAFFFLRVGILVAAMGPIYAWAERGGSKERRWSPVEEFGRASLFVYWIHVEMVYGVLTLPLHRALPLELTFVAYAGFTVFLFGLVVLKNRVVARRRRRLAPQEV